MNKISLFGGRGFIGSHFYRKYQSETFIEDRDSNNPKFNEILYLISTVHNYHIFSNLHIDIDTNLKKLISVLEFCKDRDITFNFTSSWFVMGHSKLPASETDIPNPKGFYSITKKAAEDLLICFCKTFGVKYRIFRLANVYGPNDEKAGKQKNALQYLINEIKSNKNINLYYNGDFLRDYIHVSDAVECIKFLMANGNTNEIYNIGSGRPINFRQIMDYVKTQTNSTSEFHAIEPPIFHSHVQVRDMYLDISKIEKLGWKNKINIWDGLKTIL